MLHHRLPSSVFRLPALLLFLVVATSGAAARAQESISPLPPPVTRGLYRSRWFEFLNAHVEDDARAAAVALTELKKAAQTVGVHRLSDFARTAVYEGRKAEAQGRFDRAARAYDAALILDDANCDAQFSRITLLARQRSFMRAAAALPGAIGSLFATHESRLAVFSAIMLWAAAGLAAATLGTILVLLARHVHLPIHDLREIANRFFGRRSFLPLALIVLALPLAFGLGPVWIVLFWGSLIYASGRRAERRVLAAALVAFGLIPLLVAAIAEENILERAPLYVAAVDLEERREDASAEDGLRQASAVFGEDPDVWFLMGIYAERSADPERALRAYDRAVRAGPSDYHPLLNRGNVQFEEGNFAQAVHDYETAAEKEPQAAEIYYNLALARAEAYDFDGQTAALQKARGISERNVSYWSSHPTLARVVSASYPLSRARRRIEEWSKQPRGKRLPGHVSSSRVVDALASPFALGPWAALVLALALTLARTWRGMAAECLQCGKPYCKYCKRYGDPPGYCSSCWRPRKESKGIDLQVQRAEETRLLARKRDRICGLLSFFLPGAHRYFSNKPITGFLTLFLFFFLLAAAGIDSRLFGPGQLAPASAWTGLSIAAIAAAALVWGSSLRSSRRQPHGA